MERLPGLQDFDFYEMCEAFAAEMLATLKAWESAEFYREKLGRSKPLGIRLRRRGRGSCRLWQRRWSRQAAGGGWGASAFYFEWLGGYGSGGTKQLSITQRPQFRFSIVGAVSEIVRALSSVDFPPIASPQASAIGFDQISLGAHFGHQAMMLFQGRHGAVGFS